MPILNRIENHCSILGIKETEPGKYPMKGYLAVREGDILCIPKEKSETAKHMADLVSELFHTKHPDRTIFLHFSDL